ncbi:MAG: 1,4-beta-glucanase [Oscillospiraceae bacterium]|nr:1,4-beta-glucanase [Oscillospiraceae bacterium]
MKMWRKILAAGISAAMLCSAAAMPATAQTAETADNYDWGTVRIGGGGFVSGIVTGENAMYARTDVGGAYRYDYEQREWVQMLAFINDADRGYLSVDGMCIDPTDDNTIYLLVGCAYFSAERTAIFKSTDGGLTFTEHEVTDLIKVHGNGAGRQTGEPIAVDPDNPDVIYCGGDTDGLIMSTDAGETWAYVDSFNDLGLFTHELNWPTWGTVVEKTTKGEDYSKVNGVGTIAIEDGKVYVGVSDVGIGPNVWVADVGKDNWEPLSDALPEDAYPARINKDANGDLLISYVGGLIFNGTGGGIYRYDTETGSVTDISPTGNSFGGCTSDPKDANKLVATTCGVWSSQLWYKDAWADDKVCWGDQFYRSEDGGATWSPITPGNETSWGGPLQADYLQDGGFDWIRNKAIHWCGTMVLDPRDSNRALVVSGNGVFACDNIWDTLPVYYFHPDGIEEVVALDFISVPGGSNFSAIGDYDGFEHVADTTIIQHQPNMGSTGAIAYCPQNPDVMIRIAENQNDVAGGFYTKDGGATWTKMTCSPGGKAAITQLDEDTYRFFKGSKDDGTVSYSDDYGQTWTACSGIPTTYGSKPTYMYVEPDKPEIVYAYATYFNSSWHYSKPEPTIEDARYVLCVSTDYGATFTPTEVCMYDQCDSAARIAYLGEGELILGAGWYGMYHVTGAATGTPTLEKLDVYYCKTVGFGAPKDDKSPNALYIYGMPAEGDPEGIYRSNDKGVTWEAINLDHLYGGTGNGNFIVGDMNEYGAMYMSTVGCGIVYGSINDGTDPQPTTKPTTEPTTKPTNINDDVLYGDVNLDKAVSIVDVVMLNKHLMGAEDLGSQSMTNADVDVDGNVGPGDSLNILKSLVDLVTLPVGQA